MVKTLNRLRAERDDAVARRKAALDRIDQVRAAANAQLRQLREQLEREGEVAARARANAVREATAAVEPAPPDPEPLAADSSPVPSPGGRSPRTRRSEDATSVWIRRAIALVVLVAAITAIVLIVHSP
jgi:hypothetical protein